MRKRLRLLVLATAVVPVVLLIAAATPASADDPPQVGPLAALDAVTLIPADDPILTDESLNASAHNSPPFLPPGTKWKLLGTAQDDLDPDNPFNEVFSIDTAPPAVGLAIKLFGNHVKIAMLDHQVEFKSFYVGRTCGGGSPRMQLAIDSDGDGDFDFNAHGHVNPPTFTGCLMNTWRYDDLTDDLKRWETTPATILVPPCGPVGGPTTCSWDEIEARITTMFPNHQVLRAVLVDDSSSFFVAGLGCVYFDIVTAGRRTFSNHDDTNDNPGAANDC
jgi:hypothetical protein